MAIEKSAASHSIPDTNQSSWQLAAIQLTGVTSLPVLFASVLLIQKNSFFNSFLILVIANVFLWVIRYGLMAVSFEGRKSVIDIARDYFKSIWLFGKWGVYIIAALLLLSTIALFIEETTIVSGVLTTLFSINEGPNIDPFMQISVVIGIISTIFCTGGIVTLRKLATFSLPIILLAFVVVLILNPSKIAFQEHQGLSLAALPMILGINLAVTADLPTFFRHSKSWKESIMALTILQLVSLALGVGGLFLGAIIQPFANGIPTTEGVVMNGALLKCAFVLLVALSSICANVSNVYSASVGWEVVMPERLVGKKEYLILGLLLTMLFISVAGIFSLEKLVDITDSSLINLSFVFVIGYLLSKILKIPLGTYERTVYFLAWLIPTLLNILQYSGVLLSTIPVLVLGLGVLFFIIIFFLSVRKLIKM